MRIEKVFGPKMDHLMRMQLAYDLAQARKREASLKLKRYRGARSRARRDTAKRTRLISAMARELIGSASKRRMWRNVLVRYSLTGSYPSAA